MAGRSANFPKAWRSTGSGCCTARRRAGPAFAVAGHHVQPRRSLADRRHPSRDSLAVERLYGAIMREGSP